MQPYFFPYAGYFRLFEYCDKFVIFDCVQFTRRSWITRNTFLKLNGDIDWLNMPIEKTARETLIKDLCFRENTPFELNSYSFYQQMEKSDKEMLFDTSIRPVELLQRQLKWTISKLGIECDILLSSELEIDESIHGTNRVIEIARMVGASEYVNLAGGIDLYDEKVFNASGISLKIFAPYQGSYSNILDRIFSEDTHDIKKELVEQNLFQPNRVLNLPL
jgi:hypothetical protein